MNNKLLKLFSKIPFLESLFVFIKKIKLPGFQGLPIYDVLTFFFQRFNESELQTRSRAIAFSLFLALFPTIIFLFTLIPYVPLENFQIQVLLLLKEFLPSSTYDAAYTTIEDIVSHQRGGLLSFGFFFALFVSADGVSNIIRTTAIQRAGAQMRVPLVAARRLPSQTCAPQLGIAIGAVADAAPAVAIALSVEDTLHIGAIEAWLRAIE